MKKHNKLYPDPVVELNRIHSDKNYDIIVNAGSHLFYRRFIRKPDLGCESGRNVQLRLNHSNDGKIVGIDLPDQMKHQLTKRFTAKNRVQFIRQQKAIPFHNNAKFGVVIIKHDRVGTLKKFEYNQLCKALLTKTI